MIAGESPDLLDTRAVAYLAQKKPDLAIRDNAIAVRPSAERYFHLAQAYRMAGKRTEAAAALNSARERGLTADSLHPLERTAFDRLNDELARR